MPLRLVKAIKWRESIKRLLGSRVIEARPPAIEFKVDTAKDG